VVAQEGRLRPGIAQHTPRDLVEIRGGCARSRGGLHLAKCPGDH